MDTIIVHESHVMMATQKGAICFECLAELHKDNGTLSVECYRASILRMVPNEY